MTRGPAVTVTIVTITIVTITTVTITTVTTVTVAITLATTRIGFHVFNHTDFF
jgi:hypothetical protein